MEWRIISQYPEYEISEYGDVRRLKAANGTHVGFVLKPSYFNGYIYYQMKSNKSKCSVFGHILVALTFIGKRPENKEVAHNDGNKLNNHYSNLRWCTYKENVGDRIVHGTDMKGSKSPSSKLTDDDVMEMRRKYKTGEFSYSMLAAQFGIVYQQVARIIKGARWSHLPILGGDYLGTRNTTRLRRV